MNIMQWYFEEYVLNFELWITKENLNCLNNLFLQLSRYTKTNRFKNKMFYENKQYVQYKNKT